MSINDQLGVVIRERLKWFVDFRPDPDDLTPYGTLPGRAVIYSPGQGETNPGRDVHPEQLKKLQQKWRERERMEVAA